MSVFRTTKRLRVERECACDKCDGASFVSYFSPGVARLAKMNAKKKPVCFKYGHEKTHLTCMVCAEEIDCGEMARLDCGCVSCYKCIGAWLNSSVDASSVVSSLRASGTLDGAIKCGMTAKCDKSVPIPVEVLKATAEGARLDATLSYVKRLKANDLYPPAVQVACRDPKCVGIGYLGGESIMCFVCGDQYVAQFEDVVSRDGTTRVKMCPNAACKVFVLRDGGCDHMECSRCHASYNWDALPWVTINTGAPPPSPRPPPGRKLIAKKPATPEKKGKGKGKAVAARRA